MRGERRPTSNAIATQSDPTAEFKNPHLLPGWRLQPPPLRVILFAVKSFPIAPRKHRFSDTMLQMAIPTVPIDHLILNQLGRGEMRLLALVVAVRKSLGRTEAVKGDLSTIVKSSLRKLVASNAVVDVEGVFSLRPQA